MKLMMTIFVVVTMITVDQTRYRGQYLDNLARVIATWVY